MIMSQISRIRCDECGTEFNRFVSQLRKQNYCSRDCSDKAKRERNIENKEDSIAKRMVVTSVTLDNATLRALDEIGNHRNENRSATIRRLVKDNKNE